MSIERCISYRRGKLTLSKHWPDGTRFRRPFPNITQARAMRARIDAAITDGTWPQLQAELARPKPAPAPDPTVATFSPVFLEHVRTKNRRPDFHEIQMRNILPILGDVPLKDFTRAHAVEYREQRARLGLASPTLNRGVSVLKALLSYAEERGIIPRNPLFGLRGYPEPARELRVMTLQEERAFVGALLEIDLAAGIYAGVMGETAVRAGEALRLEWGFLGATMLSVPAKVSKTKRARHIPLSDFCKRLLGMAPRVAGYPHLFVRLSTRRPVKDTRDAFEKAQAETGLDWVHPEDFRHFRATQWVSLGVDIRTVQELLGHADIRTTMRYAHFAPDHASRLITAAQRTESGIVAQGILAFQSGPKPDQEARELERLYALEAGK